MDDKNSRLKFHQKGMKLVKIVAIEVLGCTVHVNLEPVSSVIFLMYIVNVACTCAHVWLQVMQILFIVEVGTLLP